MDDVADRGSVLVLGAGSRVGRSIVAGLLANTPLRVTASGRDGSKLERHFEALRDPRLALTVLDALDRPALLRAARQADAVVNGVGPYIVNGYEIAETVVAAGRNYVDFAFEQFHYKRLAALDAPARANGVALVTGAGEVVGLSSVLCAHALSLLPGADTLAVIALEAGTHDAESGFASRMNGVLEPALRNEDYVDGRYVEARMGRDVVERSFGEPWGRMKLLSDPSIDGLILPRRFALRTVRNYFGMSVDVPFGFFPLMRLLNPYRNRVFYGMAARAVRALMRRNQARKEGARVPVAQALRVEAGSASQRLAIEVRFRSDFNATAYLPVIVCQLLGAGEARPLGLVTALDLISPDRLFRELEPQRAHGRLSWTIEGPSPRLSPDAS